MTTKQVVMKAQNYVARTTPFLPDGYLNGKYCLDWMYKHFKENREEIFRNTVKKFHVEDTSSLYVGYFFNELLGFENLSNDEISSFPVNKNEKAFIRILYLHPRSIDNIINANVHNHSFSFTSICIKNYMDNIEAKKVEKEERNMIKNNKDYVEFKFTSAMSQVGGDGTIKLNHGKECELEFKKLNRVYKDELYFFGHEQLHEIDYCLDGSISIFCELDRAPKNHEKLIYFPVGHEDITNIDNNNNVVIDMTDFYQQMSQTEFDHCWDDVFSSLSSC